MKVYEATIAENYQFFEVSSVDEIVKLQNRDFANKDEIVFSLEKEERDLLGDLSVINSIALPLFSQNAMTVFNKEDYVHFKTLDGFSLLRPKVIDALDTEKSMIDYFSGTKKLKRIRKYAFYEDKIADAFCFMLPIKASTVFFTDKFLDACALNNFKGFDYYPIYG